MAKSIHWKARTATRKWTRFSHSTLCPAGETVDEHVFKRMNGLVKEFPLSSPGGPSLCLSYPIPALALFSLYIFFLKAYKKPGFWVLENLVKAEVSGKNCEANKDLAH